MKLLIITCIMEQRDDVFRIFKESDIDVFSSTNIMGYKNDGPQNLLEDWFASGHERYDSLMIFSFTSITNAGKSIELIKIYNQNPGVDFPVRAFILPVEQSI